MIAPGPGTAVPSAAMVAPVAPRIVVSSCSTKLTTAAISAHHQYSLRLARPVKTVYFLKKRLTATPMGAP